MTHTKIDPRSPGKSTQTDDFCDPHGHDMPGAGGHAGLGRDDGGGFSGPMSRGGVSPHGDDMVAKYRSKGSAGKQVESGSELNDEGDDWA